jgi:hypothetical protein
LSTISIFFKSCRKGPWPLYRITKLIDGVKLPGCCIVCYQSRQQAERRMVLTSVAGLRFKSGARSNTNFRNNHKLYLLYWKTFLSTKFFAWLPALAQIRSRYHYYMVTGSLL